jgi:NADPH-dependent ferric siderophore reductase
MPVIPKVQRPQSRSMIALEVLRSALVTPSMLCVTLGGSDLARLEFTGLDQVVRFFFPGKVRTTCGCHVLQRCLDRASAAPTEIAPVMDTELHHSALSPGRSGDRHRVRSPSRRRSGVDMGRKRPRRRPAGILDEGVSYLPTAHARWQLLVGEESAVPAILGILEKAHPDLKAEVFLEVRHPLTSVTTSSPQHRPTTRPCPSPTSGPRAGPLRLTHVPLFWCTATVLG